MSVICIYILITLYIQGCTGDIVMSQTPESVTVQAGESAVTSCTASAAMNKYCVWYHQKPGQAPKFIMDFHTSSTSGRYQGSQSGLEFSLTISNIQTEDAGVYYCQQRQSFPLAFGGGTKVIVKSGVPVRPSVSLLPPSSEQLSAGDSATLACLLSGYNPPGAQVIWEVDGKEVTAGVLTSEEVEKDGRYGRSSTLTMSKALWEQGEVFSCKVTHEGDTQSTEITRTQCGK